MPACRQSWSVIGSGSSVQWVVVIFGGKTVVISVVELIVVLVVVVGTDDVGWVGIWVCPGEEVAVVGSRGFGVEVGVGSVGVVVGSVVVTVVVIVVGFVWKGFAFVHVLRGHLKFMKFRNIT